MLTYYVKFNAVNLIGMEIEVTQECHSRLQAFIYAKTIRKHHKGWNIRVYEYDAGKNEPMKLILRLV